MVGEGGQFEAWRVRLEIWVTFFVRGEQDDVGVVLCEKRLKLLRIGA